MTFANFILALRARLQDAYTNQGVKIVSASTDGIRWMSSELIEVVNSAASELSRLFLTYPNSELLKRKTSSIISIKIGGATLGVLSITDKSVSSVLSVKKTTGESYGYISPETYTTYLSEDKSPRLNSLFFTEILNDVDGNKNILLLPLDTVSVMYSYLYSKSDYTSIDITEGTNIKLDGFDDILLDICERECRDREHNWDRSTILTKRVLYKIGIISNE